MSTGGLTAELRNFWPSLIDDWRDDWLSLIMGVALLFAFSQAWLCPLFGYGDPSPAVGGLIRNFYYPFYLMALTVAVVCWRGLLSAVWRTPLLLCLCGLCAASYLWSIDPSGTLRRFIALFMTMLGGYALAVRFQWARLLEVIGAAFVIMMIGSYVFALLLPRLGIMQDLFPGAWRGLWAEKNNLGSFMSIGAVAAAAAALHNPQRRTFWWATTAGMILLTLLSTSKTSLVCLVLGMGGIGFIYLARKGPILGILLSWLALTVLLGLGALILYAPDKLYLLLGKDATLTGRTFIWDGITRVMGDRPLLGYGYGVVWSDESDYAPLAKITHVAGFRAFHAHSCWYEVWLALGLVGLVNWALVFADVWLKGFYRMLRGTGGYFALPLLGIYGLSSLTESMALSWNDLRWCLFVIVAVKVSLPRDEDNKAFTLRA
ncbi:O-antigen ligase family protein [Asticcacaulis sp. 201]|uniref:O-antigen ligase family protein n=1 Tax=Asticcacaulis sp. 201 TaxID=3028787 RepID=UPI002916C218|nr:O-antigen ligase family protein [Asticcacaulis sp. 201]MDV6332818.1 O-antigen ligase family protein [Asticcacaulis sp. 201]